MKPPREDLPEWAAYIAAAAAFAGAEYGVVDKVTPSLVLEIGAALVAAAAALRHAARWIERRRVARLSADRAKELEHEAALYAVRHGKPVDDAPASMTETADALEVQPVAEVVTAPLEVGE